MIPIAKTIMIGKIKGTKMLKTILFLVIVFALAGAFVWAQRASKSTTHSGSAPTKVTGTPTRTADGLEYWDIKLGSGPRAIPGDIVQVQYTGWLANGKKFDSSLDSGEPFTFQLGHGDVIKGWDEGVQGMRVGGKRQLRVPPALGYGSEGAGGGAIPPNATLIFDVELLGTR